MYHSRRMLGHERVGIHVVWSHGFPLGPVSESGPSPQTLRHKSSDHSTRPGNAELLAEAEVETERIGPVRRVDRLLLLAKCLILTEHTVLRREPMVNPAQLRCFWRCMLTPTFLTFSNSSLK